MYSVHKQVGTQPGSHAAVPDNCRLSQKLSISAGEMYSNMCRMGHSFWSWFDVN